MGGGMSWPADFMAPDFPIRVALGLVPGWSRVAQLGHNPDLNSNTVPEDIWTLGGIYPWLTGPTLVKIKSDNPADAPGGAGCASVRSLVLNSAGVEAPVTTTLNGTTFVNLTDPISACNGLLGMDPGVAGALVSNVGTITLCRQDNDAVIAVIPPGRGSSQQSQYTTPAGKDLIILGLEAALTALSGANDRSADVDTWFQAPGQIYRMPRRIACTDKGPTNLEPRTCIIVPALNRFQMRATAVSSTSQTSVNGAFEALLRTR